MSYCEFSYATFASAFLSYELPEFSVLRGVAFEMSSL